ncbi:YkgJ family cysteine cluster protein [Halovivax cerinus]|uniref:YkgJ family cysteine cluster protein n=1 Tax=Halovivax cerinus TaxID=1487865 RepID=A0ABD5NPD6_9EURY|nr:YkgJ family cysteine cluster protein [Halovivax cerinus]
MDVRCRDCAGCCLDWRALAETLAVDDEGGSSESGETSDGRRGPFPSLDGVYNLVPLERDEVSAFVDAGLGDVLTPRLWEAEEDDPNVVIGTHRVAAVRGRPAFFVGLRKPPKPVAPFGRTDAAWLPTCAFLDPTTLQCRIHDDGLYPSECDAYPAHNVALGQETECERVEAATGEQRLRDAEGAGDATGDDGLLFGPQAIGGKVFCHPEPAEIEGAVDRIARGATTAEDRAEFVAVAAASSPGTLGQSRPHYERAREATLETDSWAGEAIAEWTRLARDGRSEAAGAVEVDDHPTPHPALAEQVEGARGAPETPGWDTTE